MVNLLLCVSFIYNYNINYTNMKQKKIPISFRLDKEILDKVKIKAKKENRSINNTVETILQQVLK